MYGDCRRLAVSGSETIPLAPKAFLTLVILVENRGRVVEKEELVRKIWPDTFVEEGSLAQNISILRKTLGEEPRQPYIQTIPKRGYRFVAPVRDLGEPLAGREETRLPASIGTEGEPYLAPPQRSRLGWITGITLLILLGSIAALAGIHFKRTMSLKTQPIRSIAVLPLQNLFGDASQEYLSDGMTDALISSLAQIHSLNVTSRRSAMRYKRSSESVPQIGKELGVDAVVEGAVPRGRRARPDHHE